MQMLVRCACLWLAAALLATPALALEPDPAKRPLPAPGKDGVITLEWDDLLPADFDPERAYVELNLDAMDDTDPRAAEALKRLRAAWDQAPTVAALDGRQVRIPGFVVPLEGDSRHLAQFLLVPYIGACIHVPPPPANQLVLVTVVGEGMVLNGLYEPVWVTGALSTERSRSELGHSGYRLDASRIQPYDNERPPY